LQLLLLLLLLLPVDLSAELEVGVECTEGEEAEETAREGLAALGATGEKRFLTR